MIHFISQTQSTCYNSYPFGFFVDIWLDDHKKMVLFLFFVLKYTLFYRLSLPEGVNYGASTLTHYVMVPEPGFRVYGLSYSPQNTQTWQIISETDRVGCREIISEISDCDNINEPLDGLRNCRS